MKKSTFQSPSNPPLSAVSETTQTVLVGTEVTLKVAGGGTYTWHAVANEGIGISTYRLSFAPGVESAAIAIPSANSATYTFTPTTPGITTYRVKSGTQQVDFTLNIVPNLAPQQAVTVSAGSDHTCTIHNGALKCWGANASGQLGDGTTDDQTTPTQVTGLTAGVTAVSAGWNHTCAIHNGALKCWGRNPRRPIDSRLTDADAITTVPGLESGVTAVSAGVAPITTMNKRTNIYKGSFCAIQNGAPKCWGRGRFAQLDDGSLRVSTQSQKQVQVHGLASGVTDVSIGRQGYTCAIHNGAIKCWGYNAKGQLGDGTVESKTTPTPVTGLTLATTTYTVTANTTVTLTVTGGLGDHTWHTVTGETESAAIVGANTNTYTPNTSTVGTTIYRIKRGDEKVDFTVTVKPNLATVGTATPTVFVGSKVTLTVTGGIGDHTWHTVTNNIESPPIEDATTNTYTPDTTTPSTTTYRIKRGTEQVDITITVRAHLAAHSATTVSVARFHACMINNGALKCWGANSDGQLGDGSIEGKTTPVPVPGLTSGVTAVSAGRFHTCAIHNTALKCWGSNSLGQLGDGDTAWPYAVTPTQVTGLTSGVTAVSAGESHTCAIHNRALKCWGYSRSGELGDGTNTYKNIPTQVTGLTSGVTAVSAGSSHTCAIHNGALKCWGSNGNGRLGNGITTNRTVLIPIPIIGLESAVTAVSAGSGYTCAIHNGALKCWGSNHSGQLGDGTRTSKNTPTQVIGLESAVTAVSTGRSHACAVHNGTLKCWGSNTSSHRIYEDHSGIGAQGDIPMQVARLAPAIITYTVAINTVVTLTVTGGIGTHQWQQCPATAANFTDIFGANTDTYTPDTSTPGTIIYRAKRGDEIVDFTVIVTNP